MVLSSVTINVDVDEVLDALSDAQITGECESRGFRAGSLVEMQDIKLRLRSHDLPGALLLIERILPRDMPSLVGAFLTADGQSHPTSNAQLKAV